MTDDRLHFRPATPDDVREEHAVFCRAVGELYRAHGYAWRDPPVAEFAKGRGHHLAYDAERCWVAELDGRLVGYTGALLRGDTWFFSSLFVDPDVHGRGIGRRLLQLASSDAPPRRLTITDSIQPISNGLYASAGMLPITPLVRLEGHGAGGQRPELEPGPAMPESLAAVDAAAYGFDRAVDHALWAARWERHGWFRNGDLVAWSYR